MITIKYFKISIRRNVDEQKYLNLNTFLQGKNFISIQSQKETTFLCANAFKKL
jgi:hypothetical protein